MANKAEVLLTVVNSLPYRDLWMTADEFNAAIQAGKTPYLAYSPKAMATIGDAVLKACTCVKVYHENNLGSSSHISSTVSSINNNSSFAYLYDEMNIVAYGPRLYSLKPKADAIEQLIGLITIHDGLQKAVVVSQILLSDYSEVPDSLIEHFINDEAFGLSDSQDNDCTEDNSEQIEIVKQLERDISSLPLDIMLRTTISDASKEPSEPEFLTKANSSPLSDSNRQYFPSSNDMCAEEHF
jgi:hypothetical protein